MIDNKLRSYIEFYFQVFDYLKNDFSENNPLPPLHIYIEPTNNCNLNCPFCATSLLRRKRKNLDFGLYKRAIDSIFNNGWSKFVRLTLTGQGEPLLYKRLPDMIWYAKQKDFLSIELITNGTLLNKETGKALIESGLDRIQFSFDSIRKDTYDSLRRARTKGKSYFYNTITNILNFLMLNSENGFSVYTSISAVSTSLNSDERDSFVVFWDSLPVDNIFFSTLSTLQNNSPTAEALRFNGNIKTKPICIIPWISLSVKSSGDIVVCSHDYNNTYVVGNIENDDIFELWNNEKTRKLRKALIDGELDDFVNINHDCYSCNNPCIGCGRDDFLKDIPVYMEKTVIGKLAKSREYDLKKIQKIGETLESLKRILF